MRILFNCLVIFIGLFHLSFAAQAAETEQQISLQAQASEQQLVAQLSQLKSQYENGQFQSVWNALLAMQANAEGLFEYDALYGELALQKGLYSEALFALERATYARPDDENVRMLLAKAYLKNKNLEAAELEVSRVSSPKNIAALKASEDQQLRTFANKPRKSNLLKRVSFGVGYDSNYNFGVKSGLISGSGNIPLFTNEPIDEQDSVVATSKFSVAKKHGDAISSAKVWHRHYFDDSNSQTEVSLKTSVKKEYQYADAKLSVQVRPLWEGSEYHRTLASVDTGASVPVTKNIKVGVSSRYAHLLDDDEDLRKRQVVVGGNVVYQPSSRWMHRVQAYKVNETPETTAGGLFSRNVKTVSYDVAYKQPDVRIGANYSYSDIDYRTQDQLYLQRRSDRRHTLGVGVSKRLKHKKSVHFHHKFQDHNSNLDLYKFDRHLTTLEVSKDF